MSPPFTVLLPFDGLCSFSGSSTRREWGGGGEGSYFLPKWLKFLKIRSADWDVPLLPSITENIFFLDILNFIFNNLGDSESRKSCRSLEYKRQMGKTFCEARIYNNNYKLVLIFIYVQSRINCVPFFSYDADPTHRMTFWALTVGGVFFFFAIYAANQPCMQRTCALSTLTKARW